MYRRLERGRVVSLGSIIIVKKKFLDTYLLFICTMYIYIYISRTITATVARLVVPKWNIHAPCARVHSVRNSSAL